VVGALIAGAPPEVREKLEACGESLGLLFQVRDDELGLFGDEKELGKPVGSDIREGKKTILMAFIMEAALPDERDRLEGMLGSPGTSGDDIDFVRRLAASAAVRSRVDAVIGSLAGQARAAIRALGC